jgi:hypothetical protein
MKNGFVYLWWDTKRNKYYLGSHVGSVDDGYIGSNKKLLCAYKSRPKTFRRRILERVEFTSHEELRGRENAWLSLINDEELSKKYYNEKKLAAGGDIYSTLSEDKKISFKEKSSNNSKEMWKNLSEKQRYERMSVVNKKRRSYWTKDTIEYHKNILAKTAILIKDDLEITVKNIKTFCDEHKLNYGNMKTMLRGERKSCQGWKGKYINV